MHKLDKFIQFSPFKGRPPQIFYLHKFHSFFDGLIGYESLCNLNINIITSANKLQFPNCTLPMRKKYPDSYTVSINAREQKDLTLPTDITEGDFYVENELPLTEEIIVLPGIYHAQSNKATVMVVNKSQDVAKINPNRPLFGEINNFELQPKNFFQDKNQKGPVLSQLRLDHLNLEEKESVLKIIKQFKSIFHQEDHSLTFTNGIKHTINTKDDVPVHSKSYRYPFCHKEEVQR